MDAAHYTLPIDTPSYLENAKGYFLTRSGMVWFREVPEGCDLSIVGTTCMRLDGDLRTFRYVTKGFDRDRNVHTSAGGGIRFFLRSVAVPLVGVDIGYGIESHHLQYLIVVGA